MAMNDYYRTLGLTPEASSEDIKRAYRNLALKYHPDRNPDDHEGQERLKAINEAYQVLGDEGKRRRYGLDTTMRGACRGVGRGRGGCRRRMWNLKKNQ